MKYSVITILNSRGTVSYYIACPYERKVGEKRCFAPKGTKIRSTLPTKKTTPVYFIQKFSTRSLRDKGKLIGCFNENCDFQSYTQRIRRPLGGVNLAPKHSKYQAHKQPRPPKMRRFSNPHLEIPYRIVIDEILRPHMKIKVYYFKETNKYNIDSSYKGTSFSAMHIDEAIILTPFRIENERLKGGDGLDMLYGFFESDPFKPKTLWVIFGVVLSCFEVVIKNDFLFKYRNIINGFDSIGAVLDKNIKLEIVKEYKLLRSIRINGYGLDEFSITDSRTNGIQKLELSENALKSVSININTLRELNLESNMLENIDNVNISSLRHLYLANNKIKYFDQRKYNSLRSLNLSGNMITGTFPNKQFQFVNFNLTGLNISNTPVRYYDNKNLKTVKRLNVENTQLQILDLSGTDIKKVIFSDRRSKNYNTALKKLDVSNTKCNSLNGSKGFKNIKNDELVILRLPKVVSFSGNTMNSLKTLSFDSVGRFNKNTLNNIVALDLIHGSIMFIEGNTMDNVKEINVKASLLSFSGNKMDKLETLNVDVLNLDIQLGSFRGYGSSEASIKGNSLKSLKSLVINGEDVYKSLY